MPTIAHEIKISASPSAVYMALTTVADLETWCAGTVRHPTGASVTRQGETVDMRFGAAGERLHHLVFLPHPRFRLGRYPT